ncbi:hypothetical protein [Mycobacterium paraintracellulare]|uniref:hypothetical protein n=1 Tax=Mycobacterium paraintracellulare TaxID=1138383 RepID=UPI001F25D1E6|nr:hypothetical protein [Mycobacterium paraintracellulare]
MPAKLRATPPVRVLPKALVPVLATRPVRVLPKALVPVPATRPVRVPPKALVPVPATRPGPGRAPVSRPDRRWQRPSKWPTPRPSNPRRPVAPQ